MKFLADELRLCVKLDHVATLRNARGGRHPDPVRAAEIAIASGADGISAHLRPDRRHIHDDDLMRLRNGISSPLSLEMAATREMVDIALAIRPASCRLVSEHHDEVTTRSGLDIASCRQELQTMIQELAAAGIRVVLSVDPAPGLVDMALQAGAHAVELYTGHFCREPDGHELERLISTAHHAGQIGIECHAGHGPDYRTVKSLATIPQVVELNVGHCLIGEALMLGLGPAIKKMRGLVDEARNSIVT